MSETAPVQSFFWAKESYSYVSENVEWLKHELAANEAAHQSKGEDSPPEDEVDGVRGKGDS